MSELPRRSTPRERGTNVAELRVDLDGIYILARREMEFVTTPTAPPLHLFWHLPLGLDGSPHFIGVTVKVWRVDG